MRSDQAALTHNALRPPVADEERYGARAMTERIAQRKLVTKGLSIADIALGNLHSLIGQPLQPKDLCEEMIRQDPLIVHKADDVLTVSGPNVAEHVFDMEPRAAQISEKMQRVADHAVADEKISGVGRARSNVFEPPRKGQGLAHVSLAQANVAQSRKAAHLIVGIVKMFRDCQGFGPDLVPIREPASLS